MTDYPAVGFVALNGLLIGSFLNVLIYRIPREQSILFPASSCLSCHRPLRVWHNIPLFSWLALRGRCAYCHAHISARYPLVELGTALLFGAITLRFGVSAELPAYLYLASIGIVLALIDMDVRRLPDAILLPSYVVTVLLLMPAGAIDADWQRAVRSLITMGAMWAVYFALALAYPAMDFAEAKLAGLIGLCLGWLSWSTAVIGLFAAFLISGGSGLVLDGGRRGQQRTDASARVPFALSLVAAAVLALFVSVPISHWYGSTLAVT